VWCTLRMPDPGWAATALFMLVEERFVLTELRVVPAETSPPDQFGEWSRTPEGVNDPAGITMTLLQELRLGDLLEPISWVAKGLATAAPPEGQPRAPAAKRCAFCCLGEPDQQRDGRPCDPASTHCSGGG